MLQLPLGKAVFTPRPDYYKGMACNPLDVVTHADAVWCCVEQTNAAPAQGNPAWMLMISGIGANKYDLCDTFYDSISPTPKPGMYPAMGGIIHNASDMVPDAWDFLQTAAGQSLCITENKWQAMTKSTWHTLADGTKIGWEGIGGAPLYVLDLAQNTLRVPDVRGMYAEAQGFDGLQVGGVHGDTFRAATGHTVSTQMYSSSGSGIFNRTTGASSVGPPRQSSSGWEEATIAYDFSRQFPVGSKIAPRAFGTNRCVYLGMPK